MLILLILSLATQALAQRNSTLVVGWQFDSDDRSSWDILWTCVSTILACTWTAMHLSLRRDDNSHIGMGHLVKTLTWMFVVMAPELLAIMAVQEYREVKLILARCNTAQSAVYRGHKAFSSEPIAEKATRKDEEEPEPTKASTEATKDGDKDVSEHAAPDPTEPSARVFRHWKMAQGYYIRMEGFVLQTKDYWVYTVRSDNVVNLIQAGIIQPSDLKKSDIKDRDKSDPFSKAFSLVQSTWVAINVIARRAYDLPISSLELSTAAYVACALVTYLAWWNKPKDAYTFITLHLPYEYDSDEMPSQLRNAEKRDWLHMSPLLSKNYAESDEDKRHGFRTQFKKRYKEKRAQRAYNQAGPDPVAETSDTSADNSGEANENEDHRFREPTTVKEQFTLDMLAFMTALTFCAIHIAA
ncbi:hypothetical protein N7474_001655 [Penicillium riverlandense]|uniref:uncharacterized protein n=1 Tax=Penicillium riverlandense TaxID=1903569 RepID=UPI0025476C87|nr:uncharacterized protein N7474_001655 [Penicillium riverlandense]KAJ5833344.1 hypothetical protein N7474_001655 [Penicillium riverlandense]